MLYVHVCAYNYIYYISVHVCDIMHRYYECIHDILHSINSINTAYGTIHRCINVTICYAFALQWACARAPGRVQHDLPNQGVVWHHHRLGVAQAAALIVRRRSERCKLLRCRHMVETGPVTRLGRFFRSNLYSLIILPSGNLT